MKLPPAKFFSSEYRSAIKTAILRDSHKPSVFSRAVSDSAATQKRAPTFYESRVVPGRSRRACSSASASTLSSRPSRSPHEEPRAQGGPTRTPTRPDPMAPSSGAGPITVSLLYPIVESEITCKLCAGSQPPIYRIYKDKGGLA
ncbi:hypothetical protein PRIPAC_79073 [Pristionchus pacificus]|uniref:Uncharacterized protein n=1 Tax=Pristionchus pacificus TaxID=54126 RepID=A0A2A6CMT4_PRIPA|nr:hypothetical protein PRIPAC_79073 [Pristionchus pacificus]|eukprot:PDM79410.1 hypothetical protein PRIPAC_31989 [Pristionchus pacificus]